MTKDEKGKVVDAMSVLSKCNTLDAGTQCLAMAFLQIAATFIQGVQQFQNIKQEENKND